MSSQIKKILFGLFSIIVIASYGAFVVFAAPPSGGYTPGSTLDPDCVPGDTDCIVAVGSSITADNGLTLTGSNLQLGGSLLDDTQINTDSNVLTIGQVLPGGGGISLVTGYSVPYDIGVVSIAASNSTGQDAGFSVLNGGGSVGAYLNYNDNVTLHSYGLTVADEGSYLSYRYDNANGFDINAVWVDEYGIKNIGQEYDTNANTRWMSWNSGTNNLEYLAVINNIGDWQWSKYPDIRDDSGDYSPANFLYTNSSGSVLSAPTSALSAALWSLTGNSGTTAGTNFIGTTDAQDLVFKTDNNEAMRILADGSVGIGTSATSSLLTVNGSFTSQDGLFASIVSNTYGIAGTAYDPGALTTGSILLIENPNNNELAYITEPVLPALVASVAYEGTGGETVSHFLGEGFGLTNATFAGSLADGINTVGAGFNYDLQNPNGIPLTTITTSRNGLSSSITAFHNGFMAADTNTESMEWNVINNEEENKIFFNFQNQAIRMGSVANSSWNSGSLGGRSVAIGFAVPGTYDAPRASAANSIAIGSGVLAAGEYSLAFGTGNSARSFSETVFGLFNTDYTADETASFDGDDRLFTIGNGLDFGTKSDALTILKNGDTGIGIDNFETNTNGNIFQVGDGTTNIIGYVDDATGNWVAVSDERKKQDITDLSYGLDQVLQLHPTSFTYTRNSEHSIGFLAQQVLPIIPEAVYGTEPEGYGMSYATLTPVIVKAIQEMNLKITEINLIEKPNSWRDALIAWFGNVENGIIDLYVKTFHADRGEFREEICLGQEGNKTCVTKEQLDQLLLNSGTIVVPNNSEIITNDDPSPVIDIVIDESPDDNQETPADDSISESESENTEVTE